ncbi:heparinase II/III family protein [Altericroceibacterium endophyticum]|uniref:Heparinase n=1 Tax=Altericroceibacterium endophyticum TaxID=1808508 RepID=A0A6I4T5Y0_9SPHN|nr:heparinase II/III family protein [Altericroceibacterium endophyticum]MXO65541.1 heparinase [Altericroceibacterium endophyticum]
MNQAVTRQRETRDRETAQQPLTSGVEEGDQSMVDYPTPDDEGEPFAALDPSRSLALAHFSAPPANIAERFMRLAYQMGVPGPVISAPFRKAVRPRLTATVSSPLEGNRMAGTALRAGHFLIFGVKMRIAQADFSPSAKLTPPVEKCLHGFAWLRDLAASAPRDQCAPTAERITAAWLAANPAPGKGAPWKVAHAAHRLLNLLIYAPWIMSGAERDLRDKVLDTADETARWLDRHVARAEDGLAALAGWCAITAAGLLLTDGRPRRLYGEAGLVRMLGDFVGEDGGVLSRSPLDQIEALELLIELRSCYEAVGQTVPEMIDSMLHLLVPPLLGVVHSDGGLANWQGSGAIAPDDIAALVTASGVRTRPLRDASHWGYQRVSARNSVLQMDAAPPPLAKHARHGCASTLAFEFSHAGERLIVNCGGAAFAGGQVPVRIEQGLRATAAHSTVILDDANSTSVLINGKLGKGVNAVEIDRRPLEQDGTVIATRIEASHDGYSSRFGLIHKRVLILRDDGEELRGEDSLLPSGRNGQKGKVPFAIRFHLGPGVEVNLAENGRGAGLALADGSYWQFVSGADEFALEESMWVDGDGRAHPIHQLVIQGMASRGGGSFSWLLKKMG